MKVLRSVFAYSLFALSLINAGCGSNPPSKPAPDKVAKGNHDEHEHKKRDGHAEHAHPEEGPHHGHLIELGNEEYHAELTHDDATHTVSVYLLDSAGKVAVPVEEPELARNLVVGGKPTQFKLAASPQEGDPAGQASRFVLTDEAAHEALETDKTTGRLNVTINGKAYSGKVEHHAHDEHDKGHK